MPRQVIFDPEARAEFEEAVVWYEDHEPGLGTRFEAELEADEDAKLFLDGQPCGFLPCGLFAAQVVFGDGAGWRVHGVNVGGLARSTLVLLLKSNELNWLRAWVAQH
jgi:hypothetical protein